MKIFDILNTLKTIFEGKFRDVLSNINITFFDFSKNPKSVLEIKEGNRLSIDLSKATEEEKKLLKANILDLRPMTI